jgi:hypothetical protein
MALATPVLPPEASEQAKSGRLVPGGTGGAIGGVEILGGDALVFVAALSLGVTAALGVNEGPQAHRIRHR